MSDDSYESDTISLGCDDVQSAGSDLIVADSDSENKPKELDKKKKKAHKKKHKILESDDESSMDSIPDVDKCIICQDDMHNPIKLECNHSFCFSCIKGAMIQSGTECPLCRHKPSKGYKDMIFKSPEKLCQGITEASVINNTYVWIYSGKNCGWWYFEPKISEELDVLYDLHSKGKLTVDNNLVTICGYIFTFDFSSMEQSNKTNGAVRHIKRLSKDELVEFKKANQIKGVCGIKTT